MYWMVLAILTQNIIQNGADKIFDCPETWVQHGRSCYQFQFFQKATFQESEMACQVYGAQLVSINNREEHEFVMKWLKADDILRNTWFTSGILELSEDFTIWWKDGTNFTGVSSDWLTKPPASVTKSDHLIYSYTGDSYKWSLAVKDVEAAYICEIDRSEVFRMMVESRGFDYGSDYHDLNDILRGPQIVSESEDLVIVAGDKSTFIECIATGNPKPTYRWFRGGTKREEVTWQMDSRYTITNGRLTFSQPEDELETNTYQCEASNKFGSVLSRVIQVSVGALGEFPSDDIIPQNVRAQTGAVFQCPELLYKPKVILRWYKNEPWNFITAKGYPHAFLSRSGKLYFSELTSADTGQYYCLARLTALPHSTLSSESAMVMVSMPIPVIVKDNAAARRTPEIHNDFIAIFPSSVLMGETISMECMAFGSEPLKYSWSREEHELPDRTSFHNRNREMQIANVTLSDSGVYTCHVTSSYSLTAVQKSAHLKVEARPTIAFPLTSRHADKGGQVTWNCLVVAIPKAHITWYKNSRQLFNSEDVEINGAMLKIKNLSAAHHNGMYQCVATNTHGRAYSSAQLRVLEFKPSFTKNPVTSGQTACRGTNISIFCEPEAAPYPNFTWTKNGNSITEDANKAVILPNGNLVLYNIAYSDAGTYTCIATNTVGTATSSGNLTVVDRSTIAIGPRSTEVLVNETAFLYCHGSVVRYMDFVYKWLFNDQMISIETDPFYSLATMQKDQRSGLYIRSAQFRHSGKYTCVLETTVDSVEYSAMFYVKGPPGPVAGVYAHEVPGIERGFRIIWTDGDTHRSPIQFFTIFASNNFHQTFVPILQNIPHGNTLLSSQYPRSVVVEKLSPGLQYSFKVQAINFFGASPLSLPSVHYSVPEDTPDIAPDKVGGGGGSVGTLKITWTKLNLEDQGGRGIGYNIYWRESFHDRWLFSKVYGDLDEFSTYVGRSKFYTKYEVKVQAFNNVGTGPNSSIATVYSAEDLPIAVPAEIGGSGYNESAINVTWTPVAENRETVKGKVAGYIITYWNRWEDDPLVTGVSYPGQGSWGLITGLRYYDSDHYIYVQVYNSAGPGPPSRRATITTKGEAPLLFPRIIRVKSHGPDTVRVTWRGISTGNTEEAIKGYKIRVWMFKNDIRTARDYVMPRDTNMGIINGIRKNTIYNLRVLGYSNGGDGKLSPMVVFTLGGELPIDLTSAQILAGSNRQQVSLVFVTLYTLCVSIVTM
ncbi:contactin-like [Argonauta hians]